MGVLLNFGLKIEEHSHNLLILLSLNSVPVSAEGRVEQQKRNQTTTSRWPVGFFFGVELDYSGREKRDPPDVEMGILHQMMNFGMKSFVDSP